jgi:hypothetical protein
MGPNRLPYHFLSPTLQTDELLGRFAIALPGFEKLMFFMIMFQLCCCFNYFS